MTDTGVRRFAAAPGRVAPVGPYAQATSARGLVWTAGQIPAGPDGDAPTDFADQVRETIRNLAAALAAAGSDLAHVVKVNTFLTDLDQLETYNRVYAEFFRADLPARTSVCVDLWRVSLEIECVATVAEVRNEVPAGTLLADLMAVELPTLGHFLEDGFCDPGVRSLGAAGKAVGPARTVRVADADALAVNDALDRLRPGEVLVVDMAGDHRHACIGAVTATTALARGAAGVVVDGVVTDLADLTAIGVPVWARGTTCLTTKRTASAGSAMDVPVTVGGVEVVPGQVVCADGNGVLVVDEAAVAPVIADALRSDADEPGLRRRILAQSR